MSLILDALSRADREQRDDPAGDFALQGRQRDSSRGYWPLLVASLLLSCIVLLGIIWFLVTNTGTGDPAPDYTVSKTASALPETELPAAQSPDSGFEANAVAPPSVQNSAVDPAVTALYTDQPDALETPQSRAAGIPAQIPTVSPDETKASEKRALETESSIDIEKMVAEAERALAERKDAEDSIEEHPAPYLNELSQQERDAIATIYYSRHDFTAGASNNSVVMNGRELRIGDQVVAGVTLVDILRDSVVLEFRGRQIQLRALNSWINL